MKGFLFLSDVEFPKTHDLRTLLTMCVNLNPDFVKFRRQMMHLNNFGAMPRYPNELQLNEDDAKSSISFAEEIKDFVMNITHNS